LDLGATIDQLLKLPPEQRLEIGERLLESIDDDVAAAWDEEIARRIEEHEAGRGGSRPAREVIAELRRSLDEAD
jgi:putative addiction module component (TIGR02574 family)